MCKCARVHLQDDKKKSLKLLNKMLDYNIAEQRENKGDEIFRQQGRQWSMNKRGKGREKKERE